MPFGKLPDPGTASTHPLRIHQVKVMRGSAVDTFA
jgi:hypothetical protein